MAHAYTMKRGKNKKSKLGVRKDQQQNSERQLKHNVNLSAFLYDGPKETTVGVLGRLTGGSSVSSSARLEDVKSRLQKALMDKCSNPECQNAEAASLAECAACRQARYCCRDCQKAHWPAHKTACKAARQELFAREEEKRLHVLQALEELAIALSAIATPVGASEQSDVPQASAEQEQEEDESEGEESDDEDTDNID